MPHYRAKDLLLVPSLLSLTRVPLAVGFVLALNHPWLELAILAAAGATDVLDGFWARRHGQVTATGAVVDPITDKLFVLTVVGSLIATSRLTPGSVLLLATREIAEAPLVAWWALSQAKRRARVEQPMANVPGKLATVLQFITIGMAMFRAPYTAEMIWVTAVAGALAALSYWLRDLRTTSSRTDAR
ncbi:MAG: CDP-alcohol phosphatidyltransferase family protein [Myxococcales bacterium]|nr:CDP-alcohol phosphatidyltransferase family protein [Myxococcales bacterium]